ncbi:MAG TPA: rod shape-determining protein MreD [Leptospiraceae bacterium]|nr:rod shape-determining protein MreD [Spirochaetaceae bacterium]HBS06337.1 rod shape-determining protein MreD [Leptospiraceae bacterium]|tara:strand:- start:112512 stop:113033 length:522 start_codon:yes stop_codon:yes gene_type:complete
MFLEALVIAVGLIISSFLKGINFLSLDPFGTGAIYPDFLLIFVIFFSIRKGDFTGIWIGFFAGLLEDSQLLAYDESAREFVSIIGVHSLVYCVAGYTIGRLNRLLDRDSIASILVLVFATTLIVRLAVWLIMGMVDQFSAAYPLLGPAVFTAGLGPIWFWLLTMIYRLDSSNR